MTFFTPPGALLSRPELEAVCAHVKLPPPVSVNLVAPIWVHANFRLAFASETGLPDLLLRRVVSSPGHDSLHNELAALQILRRIGGVPIVDNYRILPPGLIAGQAALTSFLPGVAAAGQAEGGARSELGASVLREVGRVIRTLSEVPLRTFGLDGDANVFVQTAETWQAEWQRAVDGAEARARAAGADPGGLVDAAVARIRDRIGALGPVRRFALVHGDLQPRNLLFEVKGDRATLSGVVDWENACVGDPLCEWASPLEASGPSLARVVDGYGPDAARALLEPEAIARLEVYAWTRQLVRLAFVGTEVFRYDGGRRRALLVEHARQQDGLLRAGDAIRTKLARALDATLGEAGRGWRPDPADVLLRRALEALRHAPAPRTHDATPLLCALAAGLLAASLESAAVDRWIELGHVALDEVNDQRTPLFGGAPGAWTALADRVVARVLAEDDVAGWSLTALTLVHAAAARIGCGPEVRWGLEGWVGAIATSEATLRMSDADRLVHALLARAAAVRLEGLGVDTAALRARVDAQLGPWIAEDEVAVTPSAETLVSGGPPPGRPRGDRGYLLASLQLALVELERAGQLPNGASTLLRGAGYIG